MNLTKKDARRLILIHLDLLGAKKLKNKSDIMSYIKKVGCIQFDPLSIIAMNPHLLLQSRIKSYKSDMLNQLLYKERLLMDGWDKNMAIYPVEDRPYFSRYYNSALETHTWRAKDILSYMPSVREALKHGPITSKDLKIEEKIDWSWAPTSIARAVLELMFFSGELMVYDKLGSRKSYDYTSNYIDDSILSSKDPNESADEYFKWGVLRRINATGILWNKASEAFLGIKGLKSASRNKAFMDLYEDNLIEKLYVDGIDYDFYIDKSNLHLLENLNKKYSKRVSFIAPLDNLLWDRKLIKELFDFEYKWEVYTPEKERKYGYYVLPVLYGDEFIGRIEPVFEKKTNTLHIRALWLDKYPEKAFKKAIDEFADFLGADSITYGDKTIETLEWLKSLM